MSGEKSVLKSQDIINMSLLDDLDAAPLIFLLAWWLMRKSFLKNFDNNVSQASNKHGLYLVLQAYLLQLYYYFMLTSLLIVLALFLFKILFLEQLAQMSNGNYPFSVEAILRNRVLKLFSKKDHVVFNLVVFGLLAIYMYSTVICVLHEETNVDIKRNQMLMILDNIIVIYGFCYVIWILNRMWSQTTV